MEHNGRKLTNTVHRLLMRGLKEVEKAECVQIYEHLKDNPYLEAALNLLGSITAQSNTAYDILQALVLPYLLYFTAKTEYFSNYFLNIVCSFDLLLYN